MSLDYRKLEVWRVAHENALAVYRATEDFPVDERFGLTSQMRRASASVPTNIVEGCGRGGLKERLRFTRIAQGSNAETEYLVHLAHDLGLLKREMAVDLHRRYTQSGKMLTAYAKWLKTQAPKHPSP